MGVHVCDYPQKIANFRDKLAPEQYHEQAIISDSVSRKIKYMANIWVNCPKFTWIIKSMSYQSTCTVYMIYQS